MLAFPYQSFRTIAATTLGAMVGAMVALPLLRELGSNAPGLFLMLFALLGALTGYRRRESAPFFYFLLFTVATMSTILFFQMGGIHNIQEIPSPR